MNVGMTEMSFFFDNPPDVLGSGRDIPDMTHLLPEYFLVKCMESEQETYRHEKVDNPPYNAGCSDCSGTCDGKDDCPFAPPPTKMERVEEPNGSLGQPFVIDTGNMNFSEEMVQNAPTVFDMAQSAQFDPDQPRGISLSDDSLFDVFSPTSFF